MQFPQILEETSQEPTFAEKIVVEMALEILIAIMDPLHVAECIFNMICSLFKNFPHHRFSHP
jgi:hypothetical protein